MNSKMRTIWCGNLSDKVTEELLYELFLQGGPVERVIIPKDPDGKQRAYGFITYKHISSVPYALNLFDGTMLFNRLIALNRRKETELSFNLDNVLQLGQEMLLGDNIPLYNLDAFGMDMTPKPSSQRSEQGSYSYKHDRRSRRVHPYHRDKFESSNHHRSRYDRRDKFESSSHHHHSRYDSHNDRQNNYPSRSYRSHTYDYR